MTLAEFAEWTSRLEIIQQLVFLVYLYWISDVLQVAETGNS
jgi:hypothetical protein